MLLCILSPSILTSPCGGSFCYLLKLCARSHTAGRWWRRNLNPRDPWPLLALAPRSGDLSGHRTPKLRKNSCRLWESCIQVLSGDHQTEPDECVSPWRLALDISHHPHINKQLRRVPLCSHWAAGFYPNFNVGKGRITIRGRVRSYREMLPVSSQGGLPGGGDIQDSEPLALGCGLEGMSGTE